MSLTDKFDEQHAQLAAIKASEAELTEGPDAALAVLGPPTDPVRMRATLGILLRAERHQQAADLIRDQSPDEKWIELAVLVFAFLGDVDRARKMVDRADEYREPLVMHRTRFAFAEGIIEQWQKCYGAGSLLASGNWSDSDADRARTVIEVLDPLLSLVRANRRIQGDLELGAVMYAIYSARISGDEQLMRQYAAWLVKHVPVLPMVAELCLRGFLKCPDNLPNRLRVEHPGDFQSAFLAALVGLDVNEHDEAMPSSRNVWRLYGDLAAHFARHVESLHPGQDGERVACYAWWLADKVGRLFGKSDELAKRALERVFKSGFYTCQAT
jgi:hypothetical protein